MLEIPPRTDRSGLVDHDTDFRHRALGWLQAGFLLQLVVNLLSVLLIHPPYWRRQMLFPAICLGLLAIQNVFWRRGSDRWAAHSMILSLLAAASAGLVVNGPAAPVVMVPALCAFMSGFLLGSRAGRIYLIAGLALLGASLLSHESGWFPHLPAPPQVWFHVLVIMDVVATMTLVFLSLGLRSARRLHEIEAEALSRAMLELESRNARLQEEVRTRTLDLELANRELSEFGRSLSHDLQGPLWSVRGHLRTLSGQADASSIRMLEERARSIGVRLEQTMAARSGGGAA